MKYWIIFITIFTTPALADSLKKALTISAHGARFQAARLKVAAENIANENSVGMSSKENPYARKIIFPATVYNKAANTNVLVTKAIKKKKDFVLKYQPNHPAANAQGMVKYPNIHVAIERADAIGAQRSYEASIGMIELSNSLLKTTLEATGR